MTGEVFIFRDRNLLKKSAAKAPIISQTNISEAKDVSIAFHTALRVLHVKGLALNVKNDRINSSTSGRASSYPLRESNLSDPVPFTPTKSGSREQKAQGTYSTVRFPGAGASHSYLHDSVSRFWQVPKKLAA